MLTNLVQQLRSGQTGQVVYLELPHRPSSVTSATVFAQVDASDSDGESALGSPSVSTGSTTVDAASGASQANPKKLNVTATTNMVIGAQWLVTAAATGDSELFLIDQIASADYVIAQRPLKGTYASADTVTWPRIEATIDATWIADEGNLSEPLNPNPRWRVEWVYVFNGETYERVSYFDVMVQPGHHSVTMDDVDQFARGIGYRLSIDDQADDGDDLIIGSVRQVKLDLKERKYRDYAFRNSEDYNELVMRKVIETVAYQQFMHQGLGEAQYRQAKSDYWERMNNLISAANAEQQVTAEGAAGPVRRSFLTVR